MGHIFLKFQRYCKAEYIVHGAQVKMKCGLRDSKICHARRRSAAVKKSYPVCKSKLRSPRKPILFVCSSNLGGENNSKTSSLRDPSKYGSGSRINTGASPRHVERFVFLFFSFLGFWRGNFAEQLLKTACNGRRHRNNTAFI